jgi:hypothetical protein
MNESSKDPSPWGPLFLALLLFCAPAWPARAQTGFTAEDGAFSLDLPPEFVRIPTLELYLQEHPGGSGPVSPEVLSEFTKTHYGFQAPAEKWFTPPYLILILEQGKKRTAQDLFMDHVLAEKDSEAAATPGDKTYRFLGKDYLPFKHMHYYKDVSRGKSGPALVMGCYTFLTNRGFLRAAWFMGEDQRQQYEDDLHQAVMNLKLSPELEYKGEKK